MHLCGTIIGDSMNKPIKIYCVECSKMVIPRMVSGNVVYPGFAKVAHNHFWQCVHCRNFVGCHENANQNKFRPLGVIANKELKQARIRIHNLLDPLWRAGKVKRSELYAILSKELGYVYHTGELRSIEEAERVFLLVGELQCKL